MQLWVKCFFPFKIPKNITKNKMEMQRKNEIMCSTCLNKTVISNNK